MALAVEIYFDARTEERISALREEVLASGIEPSPNLEGSRPHVSLAVVETEDVNLLAQLLRRFAATACECDVRLAALASFATPQGVLFLAPVPTPDLLDMHSRLHALLGESGLESRPFYRPGSWVPHCTIEMGLSGSKLATAFDSCWRSFTPLDGRLEAAGVVSYPPPRTQFVTPLQEANGSR